ncbi:hypothetical protein NKH77_30795 [Streptomyces sp. M19]
MASGIALLAGVTACGSEKADAAKTDDGKKSGAPSRTRWRR